MHEEPRDEYDARRHEYSNMVLGASEVLPQPERTDL